MATTAKKKQDAFPNAHKMPHPRKVDADLRQQAGLAPPEENEKPLDAKFKGTHTYKLTEPFYRLGVTYKPGELITVTDEVPGKSWVKVSEDTDIEPTELQNPKDATPPKAVDENGKEIETGPALVSRIEVASQGREVPGVKSENAKLQAEREQAAEYFGKDKPHDNKKK